MNQTQVLIVLGSQSDAEAVSGCGEILTRLGITYRQVVSSAHRRPAATIQLVKDAEKDGVKVIVAAAGMAAHLPGFIASQTILPVIGVPLPGSALAGVDSLLSMVQMPSGMPVATMAIGSHGAINAAILAAEILALGDENIRSKLVAYRQELGGG
jgi:5-(carboxyamino)imidazole ribonucleotide mutase